MKLRLVDPQPDAAGEERVCTMQTHDTLATVRDCLRLTLEGFIARPFFDLREGDPQARLFGLLREKIAPDEVDLQLDPHIRHSHHYPTSMRTSRVHRELKYDEWRMDIAILRADGHVRFGVHPNGPMDILAPARGEDLAAVIEVKAAPSRNMWGAFRDDLDKLSSITGPNDAAFGFLLVLDKSLALGGSRSAISANWRWLDSFAADETGRIEVHYVDAHLKPASLRGRMKDA
jgi:hypothetical protein